VPTRANLGSKHCGKRQRGGSQEPARSHSRLKGSDATEMRLNGALYLMKREAKFAPPTGNLPLGNDTSRGNIMADTDCLLNQQCDEELAIQPSTGTLFVVLSKCPNWAIVFSRLNANSTCQRMRYN